MVDMKELGLYIHIPFCPYRCHYCDFLLFTRADHKIPSYLEALKKDLENFASQVPLYEIKSIYIGGGTPSLLTGDQMGALLASVKNSFRVKAEAEISIESNPGTLTLQKLSGYLQAGVQRISLGVQSLQDHHLSRLGRLHSGQQAREAFDMIRQAGFTNVNVDLLFGLPEQTLEEWKETLSEVFSWSPEHLSAYGLQVEKGTRFWSEVKTGKLFLPEEETQVSMYETLLQTCRQYGVNQYEISNFAKPGYECRHNLIYWNHEEYLGIGVGAVSYIEGERFRRTKNLEKYCSGQARIAERETLPVPTRMGETMMLGLRLRAGVSSSGFQRRFGKPLNKVYGSEITKFKNLDLIEWNGERLALTEKGILLSNEVLQAFL